jgi:hypothetical protein
LRTDSIAGRKSGEEDKMWRIRHLSQAQHFWMRQNPTLSRQAGWGVSRKIITCPGWSTGIKQVETQVSKTRRLQAPSTANGCY